jgi:phage tail sheath gpL-like
MVAFAQIPANWQLPLVSIEVDGSQAGTLTLIEPALLVGQKLSSGVADPDKAIAVASPAQAAFFFGQGSMLERMCAVFFKNTPAAILWCLPQSEPSSGQPSVGSIVYAASSVGAGTLPLYIAGRLISIAVAAASAASAIASAVVAAINADPYMPVTAVVNGSNPSKVDLTCKWKGSTGNDIQISHAFGGSLMRHRTVTMAQRQRRANEPDTYPAPRVRRTREDVRARLAAKFAVEAGR